MSETMSRMTSETMPERPTESRRQIDAMLFKPVPGGFLCRAPNPWIFGHAEHYVVDAQQKAELLRILVAPRPVLRIMVILAGLVAWCAGMATIGWAFSGHENPTTGDTAIMIAATIAALFLALHVALRYKRRRMQPILAAATPSAAQITRGDMRAAINRTTSLRSAVIATAVWGFAAAAQALSLVVRNARHPMFSDAQSCISVFVVVMSLVLMVRFAAIAIGKLRQRVTLP